MAKSRTKAENNNNKGSVVTLLLDSSFRKLENEAIAWRREKAAAAVELMAAAGSLETREKELR
ncbi:hypothetical protein WN944_015404 [Citrus x changshan-huyou]|uniref:Uncharacterized protein n=1 Tax=Citrus x changshan-huyou TaxID=2935761 RepID=A0AAP0QJK4_9ROSI